MMAPKMTRRIFYLLPPTRRPIAIQSLFQRSSQTMIRHASKRLLSTGALSRAAAISPPSMSPAADLTTSTARAFSSTAATLKDYEHVLVERRFSEDNPGKCGVGLITLNRPKALNALCDALFDDLIDAASTLDGEDDIGCMVITGSSKAFAAGADISEMSQREFPYAYKNVSAWLSIVMMSFGIVGCDAIMSDTTNNLEILSSQYSFMICVDVEHVLGVGQDRVSEQACHCGRQWFRPRRWL